MGTFVPKNSRRKIHRTRRAEKIVSLGMMNTEAVFRPAHSRRATASSRVFPFAVPNVSIAPAGTPNFKRIWRLSSACDGIAPVLTARCSGG